MATRFTDEQMLAALRRVFTESDGDTSVRTYAALSRDDEPAWRTIAYRFTTWDKAVAAAREQSIAHAKTEPPPAVVSVPVLPTSAADEAIVAGLMARRAVTPASQRAAFVGAMDAGAVKPSNDDVISARSQTVFIVSDIHIPHHDVAAWEAVLACMADVRPDWVIVLGDGIDLGMLSAYKRGANDAVHALDEVKAFVREMNRVSSLTKRTTIKYGNHCVRWENYLLGAKPEVMRGVKGLTLEDQCKWNGLHPSIEWTKESTFNTGIKLGSKCIARHGDKQARNGISQPRNLANNMLTKSNGVSEIVGHHHRLSYQVQTAHDIDAFSLANPCITPMHDYAGSDRRWQQGFACIEMMAPDFDLVTPYPVLMQRQRFSFRGKTYDGHAIAREMGVAA
jgi:hypothetical protein